MASSPAYTSTVAGPTRELARVRHLGPFGLVANLGDDVAGTSWAAVAESSGRAETRTLLSLRPRLVADSAFVRVVGAEIDVARRIRHHAVLQARETGIAGGGGYVTSDFVPSVPLTRLVTLRAPMPLGVIARIARDLTSAIDELHGAVNGRGEPHPLLGRAASPGWMRLGIDGRAFVIDHGIARALFESAVVSHHERRVTMSLIPDWAEALTPVADYASVARIVQRLLSAGRRSESGLFALARDDDARRRVELLEALAPLLEGQEPSETSARAAWRRWQTLLGGLRAFSPNEVADWLKSTIPQAVRTEVQRDEAIRSTAWELIAPAPVAPTSSLTAAGDYWDQDETTIRVRDEDVELLESDVRAVRVPVLRREAPPPVPSTGVRPDRPRKLQESDLEPRSPLGNSGSTPVAEPDRLAKVGAARSRLVDWVLFLAATAVAVFVGWLAAR